MDFRHLFTAFDGRINRGRFWLGVLILIAVGIVLSLVIVTPLAGVGPRAAAFGSFVIGLAMLYPALAVGVKRFHDRGKPGWLMAIVVAPGLISQLGDVLGITTTTHTFGDEVIAVPNTFGWILIAISLGVAIWALVELGIRKGTDGPNEYGADPLEKA